MARAIVMRWRWPPGEPHAHGADLGVVAIGELVHELVDVGRARGREDLLLRGVRPPVAQVLADRRVEEERLLPDHGDLREQAVALDLAQVDAVELDAGRNPGRRSASAGRSAWSCRPRCGRRSPRPRPRAPRRRRGRAPARGRRRSRRPRSTRRAAARRPAPHRGASCTSIGVSITSKKRSADGCASISLTQSFASPLTGL